MLLGYDAVDLLLALGAGFACGFLNTAASSGSVVTLPDHDLPRPRCATANATNRLPVLVGALSGALDFARRKAMPWRLAFRIAVPTTLGSLIGAGHRRDRAAARHGHGGDGGRPVRGTAALQEHQEGDRAGAAERGPAAGRARLLLFFAAGVWLGFIVLDGATCLLAGADAGRRPVAGAAPPP